MISANLSDPWLAVAVGIFVLAVMAIALFAVRERRPAASTDAKLDDLAAKVSQFDHRMGQVEEKQKTSDHDLRNVRSIVQNLPTKDSISRLTEQVAETRGQIGGMQGTLQSQSRSLDRIEDFLVRVSVETIVHKGANQTNGEA